MWPFKKKKKKSNTISGLERKINAKSKDGSFSKWNPRTETLLEELNSGEYSLIRRRCKQSSLNVAPLKKAVLEYKSNLIGTGIKVFFNSDNEDIQSRVRAMWKKFTEARNFSSDGELSFNSMQRLIVSEIASVGEVFLKRNVEDIENPEDIPYSYQLITPDRVDDVFTSQIDERDKNVVMGISYDDFGKKIAYYFKDLDDSGNLLNRISTEVVRVPASEVHHVYNRVDASFRRGMPLLLTAIIPGWLSNNLDESQMKKQIIASMFAGFIKDLSAEISADTQSDEDSIEGLGNRAGSEIQSGTITNLDPGKDITFPDPPKTDGYSDFDKSVLRKISAATGLSYESISNDYAETNYSSARHSAQRSSKIMDMIRDDIIIEMLINPVLSDFMDYIELMQLFPTEGIEIKYVTPKPIIIDPAKEINPKTQEIRSGLLSWGQAIAERGGDPEDMAKQIAKDYELLDKYDIKIDSDGREVDKQGQLKQEPAVDDENNVNNNE